MGRTNWLLRENKRILVKRDQFQPAPPSSGRSAYWDIEIGLLKDINIFLSLIDSVEYLI